MGTVNNSFKSFSTSIYLYLQQENTHSWMNQVRRGNTSSRTPNLPTLFWQIHEVPPPTNVAPPPSAPVTGQEHKQT